MPDISVQEHPKKFVSVNGKQMAYVELGAGEPIVFLHGNPTSSYLWRNVMPHVSDTHRAIAPDLIGMGDSEKLDDPGPDSYRFVEHREYLNSFMDAVVPDGKIVLVIHDWGSALGFDWAHRNAERVKGICFMEGIVGPVKSWDHWNEQAKSVFQALRSPAGEDMILQKNIFIERILTGSILRKLSDEEMNVYRRPFANVGEDRRPTLTWPRQIPIEGEPEDVHQIVSDYAAWLPATEFPKLFVNADPGAILLDHARAFVRSWKNVSEVTVKGSHFIQEDSPHEIGSALRDWVGMLD
ncbi:MAG: haloalkane dehalogenase [Rhizobiaceae bacterium]|nr:haloalkane dehalogenase [Rhizobiaceae bacterium]